jgi:hypothetical protein
VVDPAREALIPPCIFNKLTGLYCPGCGSMRALHAALHGNLAQALDFNALAVFLIPFLVYSTGRMILQGLASPESGHRRASRFQGVAAALDGAFGRAYSGPVVLVAVICFWVARNLPWSPFTILAP